MSQLVVEMNLNLKPKSCSKALALQNTKPLNFKTPDQHLVLQIAVQLVGLTRVPCFLSTVK